MSSRFAGKDVCARCLSGFPTSGLGRRPQGSGAALGRGWGNGWRSMAWWIHDRLPYSYMCFYPKLGAFNIQWREQPCRDQMPVDVREKYDRVIILQAKVKKRIREAEDGEGLWRDSVTERMRPRISWNERDNY